MKESLKEMDFTTLKNNFDEICDEINKGNETVTLTLKSGRKVFIMAEESYENVNIKCESFFDFFAFSNTHNKQCYLLCIFYIMQVLVLV